MLARMIGGLGCPDENALVRFSTGQLSGTDLGSLEAHLDGCGACRSLIAQLASLGAVAKQTGGTALGDAPAQRHGRVGRYQVERLVGGGGMGMVYAARDQELNRVVAIKLLRTSALGNLESRTRLLREAQTMAKLSHPNLVPIFELGSDQGDDFLAMELIDGPTLDLWLRERKRGWREVVQIFVEAGRGLEAAHQAGVVHRDFKPSNVLVGPDGRARVTDFGLARPMASALATGAGTGSIELTREGSLLGTPAYMSPEQLEGQVADVRSDQFSFCVCLAEALSGHRPFPGRTPEELRRAMRSGKPPRLELESARLKRTLLKGMSIAPDGRFDSMGELLEELAVCLKPSRANPRAVAGAMALAVVLAAGAGVAWQQLRPAAQVAPVAVVASKTVRVAAGARVVVSLPGVQTVTVADEAVVDARAVANQRITLTGLSAGRTTLKLQTRASPDAPLEELAWEVVVEDQGTQELRFIVG
ncbi:MAG: Serine/threonine kinase family protein, partial [Myxococcaceae bacterium]|nr:Serine/threonine kinase family protein [Myxococcaceae bacterium]